MTSKRIQGITIEIGGDTSKLQTALKGVDTELRKTQGNLKDINKLLKLDPGNTELLVQKQKNLQSSIKGTEDRLKTLKSTQTDALSPDEYDALQREIIDTEQHLEGLQDEYKAFGSVAQQKIAAAGQQMQEMGGKISDAGRRMQEIGGVIPGELKKIGSAINEHVLQPMLQVAKVVGAAGFAATTALTKGAVDAAAEYEQLSGGIVKLYGDAAAKVVKNANGAYKSAGKSANDYMKTVTAFSASLITSMGGNAEKAARVADMAIRDMSDNANTFGTDIASVEATYQSLAKQQYTTLDNLKLGYAGTKAGMDQLIRDAERMDQTFQVTHKTVKKGKEVNDELAYSYADIVQAIHIVQDNMKITGTTTKEASKTIEGSFNAMKAAWSNLLTAIGSGEDVRGATRNVLNAAGTYLKDNLLPTIRESLTGIGVFVDEAWAKIKPQLPELKRRVVNWLNEKIPEIPGDIAEVLSNAIYVINLAISAAFAVMSSQLSMWITGDNSLAGKFRNSFLNAKKDIEDALQKIGGALSRLWNGTLKPYLQPKLKNFIEKTLPKLTDVIGEIADGISSVIDWFNDLDPEIKNTILDIGLAIIAGSAAVSGIGKVITAGGNWITNIGSIITKISGAGGLIGTIKTLISWLTNPVIGIPMALAMVGGLMIAHWDDIKKLWENGVQWIKSKVDWLKNVVPAAWRNLWNALPDPVKNAVSKIKSFLSSMISKINTALNKLDNFIRKNQQTRDTVPSKARTSTSNGYYNDYGEFVWYAKAYQNPVVFTKPTVLQTPAGPKGFGDGPGAEVVMSMTKLKELVGSGTGTTNVNITINPQPGQSAEQIAAAVKRVFVREMQQREAAYA